jgi:hypothetical protein
MGFAWLFTIVYLLAGTIKRDRLIAIMSAVILILPITLNIIYSKPILPDFSTEPPYPDEVIVMYQSNGDGTCIIVDCDDDRAQGFLTIGEYSPDGDLVVGVGNSAFDGCRYMEGLSLPATIRFIGDHAFSGCYSLRELNLPQGIQYIDDYAFEECRSLYSLGALDNMWDYSTDLEYIGMGAFVGCVSLNRVNIPSTVNSVGMNAFLGCKRSLEISCYLAYHDKNWMADTYFWNPDGCQVYYVNQNGEYSDVIVTGEFLFSSNGDGTCTVTGYKGEIPENLEIPAYSYDGERVVAIGTGAFAYSEIKWLHIPDGVEIIGVSAFMDCDQLESVYAASTLRDVNDSAFLGCEALGSVWFGEGVENIGAYAFAQCPNLREVLLPNSLIYIGEQAFMDCPSLYSLGHMTQNCYESTMNIESIGNRAFANCTSLREVKLGNKLYCVGQYAFAGCHEDLIIYCHMTNPLQEWMYSVDLWNPNFFYTVYCRDPWVEYAQEIDENGFIFTHYGDGTCSLDYGSEGPWTGGYLPETSPSGWTVVNIGTLAFVNNTNITNVIIPDSVYYIGASAFSGCTNLTNVTFSHNLVKIDEFAFAGCTGLEYINLPNSCKAIGKNAFERCSYLESLRIPESTEYVGSYAFLGCYNLTIRCVANSIPDTWGDRWNSDGLPVRLGVD